MGRSWKTRITRRIGGRFFPNWLRRRIALQWQKRWSRADFRPAWRGRPISKEIVAAWFADRGFPALGIDIAPAAIDLARGRHTQSPNRLEFRVHDICTSAPTGGSASILIDRGCFHTIPDPQRAAYLEGIGASCRPGARLLLFVKSEGPNVRVLFEPLFSIERRAETELSRPGEVSSPGNVFWMLRR